MEGLAIGKYSFTRMNRAKTMFNYFKEADWKFRIV